MPQSEGGLEFTDGAFAPRLLATPYVKFSRLDTQTCKSLFLTMACGAETSLCYSGIQEEYMLNFDPEPKTATLKFNPLPHQTRSLKLQIVSQETLVEEELKQEFLDIPIITEEAFPNSL